MMEQALMQERMIKETMSKQAQKKFEDANAGAWRIVAPTGSQPIAHFVRYSERDQYNLLTDTEYKTEQKAALALALLTRPTQLTHTERVQLLTLLEGGE